METIKTYLDNVFAAYPQTNEVQTLKRDMLANMEEKYAVLRQSGKSEHEAAYNVIADFGNIEEITAELGLDIKNEAFDGSIYLSLDEAQSYIANSMKSGIWIGLGVWLIIAGASTYTSSIAFFAHGHVMLPVVAIAVVMFIMSGGRMRQYKSYGKTHIRLDSHSRKIIESDMARIAPRCTAMIAAGVALIILTLWAQTSINVPSTLFLNIVGLSVFMFIFASRWRSAFDVLLGQKEHGKKGRVIQVLRNIAIITVIYWPIIVAINMYLLFIVQSVYFWVVWPVAGVLFFAIIAAVAIWQGTK